MVKKRGLGKGLDALLGNPVDLSTGNVVAGDTLKTLPVDLLQRGRYQPRQEFGQEALQELANSISAQGMVQPIVVRRLTGVKKFEIIAGERRWRAAQLVGLEDVPVIIKDDVSDKTVMCIALIENIQREDLNPLEEAYALDRLIREFDMRHEDVATAVGRSRSAVSNLLRLLDLGDDVKEMLRAGQLEMGHARALLGLPKTKQPEAANRVIKQRLSVRATEALVKQLDKSPNAKTISGKQDPNILKLQNDLSEKLGARIIIKQQGKRNGVLKIHYNSPDELDGILKHIK